MSSAPILGMKLRLINALIRELAPPSDSSAVTQRNMPIGSASTGEHGGKLQGVRHYLPSCDGDGYWDLMVIRKGLYLSITDAIHRRTMRLQLPPEPLFKIRILLSGRLRKENGEVFANSNEAVIHTLSGAAPASYEIEPGETPFRMIVLHGQSSALAPMGLDADALGAPFREILKAGRAQDAVTPIPGGLTLLQLSQDIFNSRDRFQSDLRAHYLAAKAEELLCLALERTRPKRNLKTGANRLLSRDLMRLHEARSILAADMTAPPGIAELSRMIGMNATKLKIGFRELYGETIQTYVTRARLESALSLIETTDLPLSEISYRVGYRYPANFTQAFKKHFGMTPSAARQTPRPDRNSISTDSNNDV